MNRLGLSVAFVSSLVAGCVASDQTDSTETGTSSQNSIVLSCIPSAGGICPTLWSTSVTGTGQYWAGAGTDSAAKVMNILYFPTKADPTTGLATAYYAWMMAGNESCSVDLNGNVTCAPTNTAFRVYEVPASLLSSFHSYARYYFDVYETSHPGLAIWDGGMGGPIAGSPGHPVGPGGFPGDMVTYMQNTNQALRNLYINAYNATSGIPRTTATGIAAP